MTLNPQEKINLFKLLFAGRIDVFAEHWISRDGKKQGWFPVHTNYNSGVYAPVTDKVLEAHLRGHKTVGVYPLLMNNTSSFVAADFDGDNWQKGLNSQIGGAKNGNSWHNIEKKLT